GSRVFDGDQGVAGAPPDVLQKSTDVRRVQRARLSPAVKPDQAGHPLHLTRDGLLGMTDALRPLAQDLQQPRRMVGGFARRYVAHALSVTCSTPCRTRPFAFR